MSALILIPIATACLSLYKLLQPDPLPPAPPQLPPPPPPPPAPAPPPRKPTEAEIAARQVKKKLDTVKVLASFKGSNVPSVTIRGRPLRDKFENYLDDKIGDEFDNPDKVD